MECKNCGKKLGGWPEEKVEDGELDEVIGHKRKVEIGTTKDFFCRPNCFIEYFEGASEE